MLNTLYLAAAEAAGGGDITSYLLQYGVLGLFAGVMLLYVRTSVADLRADKKAAEEEVKRLNTIIQEKLIPAVTAGNDAMKESNSLIKDLQYKADLAADLKKMMQEREAENRRELGKGDR